MFDEYTFLLTLGAGIIHLLVGPEWPWSIVAAKGTPRHPGTLSHHFEIRIQLITNNVPLRDADIFSNKIYQSMFYLSFDLKADL